MPGRLPARRARPGFDRPCAPNLDWVAGQNPSRLRRTLTTFAATAGRLRCGRTLAALPPPPNARYARGFGAAGCGYGAAPISSYTARMRRRRRRPESQTWAERSLGRGALVVATRPLSGGLT